MQLQNKSVHASMDDIVNFRNEEVHPQDNALPAFIVLDHPQGMHACSSILIDIYKVNEDNSPAKLQQQQVEGAEVLGSPRIGYTNTQKGGKVGDSTIEQSTTQAIPSLGPKPADRQRKFRRTRRAKHKTVTSEKDMAESVVAASPGILLMIIVRFDTYSTPARNTT